MCLHAFGFGGNDSLNRDPKMQCAEILSDRSQDSALNCWYRTLGEILLSGYL